MVPRRADATDAMDAVRRIVHALHSANSRTQGSHSVSAAQVFLLREIASAPGLSMSALAQRTRSTPSSASEVVSRLVADGLVDRRVSRDDARRVELRLTERGRDVADRAGETIQEQLIEGFESLPAETGAQLVAALKAWLERAGLSELAPRMFFDSAVEEGPVPAMLRACGDA